MKAAGTRLLMVEGEGTRVDGVPPRLLVALEGCLVGADGAVLEEYGDGLLGEAAQTQQGDIIVHLGHDVVCQLRGSIEGNARH